MAIIQKGPGGAPELTADVAAVRVRRQFGQATASIQQALNQIKRLSDTVGNAELVTALGDDGAALSTTYDSFKTFLLSVDAEADVQDLT
jgi:hypothetical protein